MSYWTSSGEDALEGAHTLSRWAIGEWVSAGLHFYSRRGQLDLSARPAARSLCRSVRRPSGAWLNGTSAAAAL